MIETAILIAAGPGTRLSPLTNNKPKCLLEINGTTIFEHTLSVFRENNISDIAVVVGHMKERIMEKFPDLTYYENPDYLENNILRSLFYASDSMDKGFVSSYSDIAYDSEVVRKLLDHPGDIVLTVDTDWADRYVNRTKHPKDQAELVVIDENNRVKKISKFLNPDVAFGEFIGTAKFSAKGSEILQRNYHRARENKWCGYRERFQDAASIDMAYLTDMIQELIDRGYPVEISPIKNNWVEIDTHQDLEFARERFGLGLAQQQSGGQRSE